MVNKNEYINLYWEQACWSSHEVATKSRPLLFKLLTTRVTPTKTIERWRYGVTIPHRCSAAGPCVVASEATWGHHSIVNRSNSLTRRGTSLHAFPSLPYSPSCAIRLVSRCCCRLPLDYANDCLKHGTKHTNFPSWLSVSLLENLVQ